MCNVEDVVPDQTGNLTTNERRKKVVIIVYIPVPTAGIHYYHHNSCLSVCSVQTSTTTIVYHF